MSRPEMPSQEFVSPLAVAFGRGELGEETAGRIRAAQIRSVVRLTPISMAANVANVLIVTFAFRDTGGPLLLAWAVLTLILAGLGLYGWAARRHAPPVRVSRRGIRRATRHALLIAAAWAFVPLWLFPGATGAHQLLIACLVTGMMCAGGFALATLPRAATLYVAVIGSAVILTLGSSGLPGLFALAGLMTVYALMIVGGILGIARLFVERFIAEAELDRRNELIGLLLNDFETDASDWLWETDAAGRLQHVSARFAEVARCSVEDLRDVPLRTLVAPAAADEEEPADLAAPLAARVPFRDLAIPVVAGGERRWWSLTGRPQTDQNGDFAGYRGVGTDITESRLAEATIAHLAHHDPLTGLANRILFGERLDSLVASGRKVTLVRLDLDGFRGFNEALGSRAADSLLQQVASRLILTAGDALVARLGGDEFAVLREGLEDEEARSAFATGLIEAIGFPFRIESTPVMTGASAGVASLPEDACSAEDLVLHAGLALSRAKLDGRGSVRLFDAALAQKAQAEASLAVDLRRALASDDLSLAFQPLVDARNGAIVGFEALLRWQHAALGVVSPTTFIPVAEDAGLILRLGAWALTRACREAASWPAPVKVAVNLSPAQFACADLVEVVGAALAESGLAPERLELEITESVLLADQPATYETLRRLRDLGVAIALDDFGTGYSSLSYLRRFSFQKLKIDQSFVGEMATHSDSAAIIRSVVMLAKSLGLTVTAEGVETSATSDLLRALGCDQLQGYLFGRPVNASQVAELLRGAKVAVA